jgi:HlyD family secretion protein
MKLIKQSIIVFALLSTASCNPKYDEATTKSGPVTEAVFASGSIEPKDAYTITALFDGFILKSYVSENDLVKDGQLLFRLDNRQQRTQVNIAQTNVTYAKINASDNSPALLQLKAQINAARAKKQTDLTTGKLQGY